MTAAAMLKIERARWWALKEQPFYGALAMRLIDVIDPSIKTACTNGKVIKWNPAFVEAMPDEEVRFVLLHEAMHCAHLHMWRLPADDIGNQAGDHAINLTLKKIPRCTMPKIGLADARFENMAEEEIYNVLQQEQPPPSGGKGKGKQGGGAGSGGDDGDGEGDACGSFEKPADGDEAGGSSTAAQQAAQSQELRDSWETAVIQSAQTAQALGQGNLPADLARELERMRAVHIDWRRELSDFIRDKVSARNDWTRCARRHAWQSVIFPRRRADDVSTIVGGIDTSGSIDARTLSNFVAHMEACALETGARVLLVFCDAAVQSEHWIEPGEACPLDVAKGGGGTDFRPVFERADKLVRDGERVSGIVYLTDLAGTEPDHTEHATLWLSTTPGAQAKIGRTVLIDERGES